MHGLFDPGHLRACPFCIRSVRDNPGLSWATSGSFGHGLPSLSTPANGPSWSTCEGSPGEACHIPRIKRLRRQPGDENGAVMAAEAEAAGQRRMVGRRDLVCGEC
jgi:hypothetical protein